MTENQTPEAAVRADVEALVETTAPAVIENAADYETVAGHLRRRWFDKMKTSRVCPDCRFPMHGGLCVTRACPNFADEEARREHAERIGREMQVADVLRDRAKDERATNRPERG